ncbi:hypothetical protein AB834_06660 [PVC group bacterium (ex Bugula neritina AB1)]|nr:hypothetical protein AB834_06660 [PVC group bacterium (ex Bugula neritina AB1)]
MGKTDSSTFKEGFKLDKKEILSLIMDENVHYVLKEFSRYVEDYPSPIDFCLCSNCVLDVIALTLNSSPSHYRCLGRHAHREMEEVQRICHDVRVAMKKAIVLVKKRPHHG